MIAIGLLFARMLCDCFKSRRRLEAENLVLRHQLNVSQQRAPRLVYLRWADRAPFIWLYRRSHAPPSVHQMVLTLEREGFIRRRPRVARSIEVLVDLKQLPELL
jgi:hypothetical protein